MERVVRQKEKWEWSGRNEEGWRCADVTMERGRSLGGCMQK